MTIEKVTDPKLQVTDPQVISVLSGSDIDLDYVEFHDYDRMRPFAKEYVDRKSNLRVQVISNLPMCRKDDGSKTLAGWECSGDTLYNKNNLFEAEITGARLSLSCVNDQPSGVSKSDELVWSPQLFIGGEEIALISSSILETDPLNNAYHDNVIAFDYGSGIKRYLRIIEGRMREWWEFTERPTGEVRVKHNQSGTAFLKLGHGMSGIEPLDIAVENGDEEILRNLDYALPFTIGASATFYPDANPETATVDGWVGRTSVSETWTNIRTGAGNASEDSTDNSSNVVCGFIKTTSDTTTYTDMKRMIFLFDTSSISDSDDITGATFSIYSTGQSSAGTIPVGVSTSNPASNTALVNADYNYTLFGSTLLGANSLTGNSIAYKDIVLNPSGIAVISKTGVTKLALRHVNDITNLAPYFYIAPADYNNSRYGCRMSEAGASYKPKLIVTTETPSGGREPRGRYHGV